MKALDRKLGSILAGTYTPDDFVVADAKDADMAFGVRAPGPAFDSAGRPRGFRTRPEYLADMAALVRQGELDVLLCSAANGERLTRDGVLDGSDVTLAVRANDSTDIWSARGARYPAAPSRPFRTARLDHVRGFCDLVLYSVTFNNDPDLDRDTLTAYARFREEAAAAGIRHFLEVFNPNAPFGLDPADLGGYLNDMIVRTLAGVTAPERPLFLKIAYNGEAALAELAGHDPSLVVGVLGGSSGTVRDTYELLHRAERHGARVALFGRKIQQAESQPDLVELMRPVLRGDLSPADAVREYHRRLAALGLTARRTLDQDLQVTERALLDD